MVQGNSGRATVEARSMKNAVVEAADETIMLPKQGVENTGKIQV